MNVDHGLQHPCPAWQTIPPPKPKKAGVRVHSFHRLKDVLMTEKFIRTVERMEIWLVGAGQPDDPIPKGIGITMLALVLILLFQLLRMVW